MSVAHSTSVNIGLCEVVSSSQPSNNTVLGDVQHSVLWGKRDNVSKRAVFGIKVSCLRISFIEFKNCHQFWRRVFRDQRGCHFISLRNVLVRFSAAAGFW